MNSAAVYANSAIMGIYEADHQSSLWSDSFKPENIHNSGISAIIEAEGKINTMFNDAPDETLGLSKIYDQEANKPSDKVLRRLAQNREAARKSRLRKKAYVQQLESSHVKLSQLQQEIEQARHQALYIERNSGKTGLGSSRGVTSGIAAFEMEYGHWMEEQNKQTCELRAALLANISDVELRVLVENGIHLYDKLFRMKQIAAKSDVFYIVSGMWKTAAERFFLWIGGFRPSEVLKVLSPKLEPLMEQQVMAVYNLQQSSQQAEDALSQGMEKLQQTISEALTLDSADTNNVANYMGQMVNAMGRLEALENFVGQADHLRQQTMKNMYNILTTRQAARGLLALGDYFQRLRALSSLWAARPREQTS